MLIIQFNFASIYNSLKEDITLIVWIYHIVLNFSEWLFVTIMYYIDIYRRFPLPIASILVIFLSHITLNVQKTAAK